MQIRTAKKKENLTPIYLNSVHIVVEYCLLDGLKNVINEYVFAAISYSQKSKKTYTHLLPFR